MLTPVIDPAQAFPLRCIDEIPRHRQRLHSRAAVC